MTKAKIFIVLISLYPMFLSILSTAQNRHHWKRIKVWFINTHIYNIYYSILGLVFAFLYILLNVFKAEKIIYTYLFILEFILWALIQVIVSIYDKIMFRKEIDKNILNLIDGFRNDFDYDEILIRNECIKKYDIVYSIRDVRKSIKRIKKSLLKK